jgi:hypothetical protein
VGSEPARSLLFARQPACPLASSPQGRAGPHRRDGQVRWDVVVMSHRFDEGALHCPKPLVPQGTPTQCKKGRPWRAIGVRCTRDVGLAYSVVRRVGLRNRRPVTAFHTPGRQDSGTGGRHLVWRRFRLPVMVCPANAHDQDGFAGTVAPRLGGPESNLGRFRPH